MEKHSDMAYKKYTLALLIVAVAAMVVCAAAFSLKRDTAVQTATKQSPTGYYSPNTGVSQENEDGENADKTNNLTAEGKAAAVQDDDSYTVTVYNGKIGVFKNNESKPFITADVDVYLLPQDDIDILKKGLHANNFSQVKSILEDYE